MAQMSLGSARRLLVAVLVVLPLLLGGCGNGDEGEPSASATTQTAAPERDPAADMARAQRINLTLADLGPGWRLDTSQDASGSSEAFDAAFDQALAAKGLRVGEAETIDADSPDFARGEYTYAFSTVSVYEDEGEAAREFAVTASDDFLAVLSDSFNKGITDEVARDPEAKGVMFSPIRLAKVPFPVLGHETFAIKGQTTVRGPGGRLTLSFDGVVMRQDRAVAFLGVVSSPREFGPSQFQAVAAKIGQRLAA